jgi:hypothetical protein
MAAENWMEIYRSYEAAELNDEIAQLKKDLRGALTAQGSGSVSHQRDVVMLENRLQAATRVKNERANRGKGNGMKGTVDFSRNGWGRL